MITTKMSTNRGELATILTIATLVLLGVITTLSATVLKNKKLSSKSRADSAFVTVNCADVTYVNSGQSYIAAKVGEAVGWGCKSTEQFSCLVNKTDASPPECSSKCICETPAGAGAGGGGGGGDPDPDRCVKGITSVKIEGVADGATITNRSLVGVIQTTSPKIGEFTADKRNVFGIWADGEQHPGYGCTAQPNDYGDSITTKFTCNLPEDKVPTGKKFRVVGARLIGDKCTGDFAVTSPGTSMWGPNKYFPGPEYTFGTAAAGGGSKTAAEIAAEAAAKAAADAAAATKSGGGTSKFACMDCILGKNPGLTGTLVCYLNNDTNKAQCQKNMDAWCSGGAGKPAIDDCAKKKKECSAACDPATTVNQTPADKAAAAAKAKADAAAAAKTGTTINTTNTDETITTGTSDLVASNVTSCTQCDKKISIIMLYTNANSSTRYSSSKIFPEFFSLGTNGSCNMSVSRIQTNNPTQQGYEIRTDSKCVNFGTTSYKVDFYVNDSFGDQRFRTYIKGTSGNYRITRDADFVTDIKAAPNIVRINVDIPKQNDDQGNGQQTGSSSDKTYTIQGTDFLRYVNDFLKDWDKMQDNKGSAAYEYKDLDDLRVTSNLTYQNFTFKNVECGGSSSSENPTKATSSTIKNGSPVQIGVKWTGDKPIESLLIQVKYKPNYNKPGFVCIPANDLKP